MGARFAPSVAGLFMVQWEEELISIIHLRNSSSTEDILTMYLSYGRVIVTIYKISLTYLTIITGTSDYHGKFKRIIYLSLIWKYLEKTSNTTNTSPKHTLRMWIETVTYRSKVVIIKTGSSRFQKAKLCN